MKSTNLPLPILGKSRQRQRTERKALDLLDANVKLPPLRRRHLRDRIRSAKQPLREAQKITCEVLLPARDEAAALDHSDVQELRVRLIRRDFTLCSEQECWLDKLDRRIADGTMTRAEFENEGASLLSMENSLPFSHRKAEYEYQRVMA
ncbi:hypothetical protein [Chelativorans sp. AA-79]|uniref:hypothetical protein n=1 Tax=Chelativorans sp. AA-79 TaxID=3028735 RepID=UPI0023F6F0F6|nr:hypothetical protein [Chelativorans sp. AA-79]WEX07291.1 hypothetical protein PVE73_14235 [Chelativorans sp. AA-79]